MLIREHTRVLLLKQKRKSFPYILIKSSEPRKFCTAELLLFTVLGLGGSFCDNIIVGLSDSGNYNITIVERVMFRTMNTITIVDL